MAVLEQLVLGDSPGMQACDYVEGFPTFVAKAPDPLPEIPLDLTDRFQCRNSQLAWAAIQQISDAVNDLVKRFGKGRIGIAVGTSTSGIGEGENALKHAREHGDAPSSYRYQQQEIGCLAEFIAEALSLGGPAYTISTACSSSGHAFNSGQAMLENNLVDAVIVGGVDSLCRLTVNGFSALESVSPHIAKPFSRNREGINIGEAAALFIMTKEPSERAVELLSVGSSSDAHHISAPHPEGLGAEAAIRTALKRAAISPADITYINLHGTGTKLNDAMESKVVERLFGAGVPCSSSKGQLGHSLGAAAANELALCWLSLQVENHSRAMPPHLWDGQADVELQPIALAEVGARYSAERQCILSNSFAFGGNNTAVIIRECNHDR